MTLAGAMRIFASFATVAAVPTDSLGFLALKENELLEIKQKNAALKMEVTQNAPHLPDVSVVLAGEKAVFQNFREKTESLLQRLASAEEEGAVAIKDSKAKYDVTLNAQHEQNLAVERKNEDIAQEITVLHSDIAEARSAALELKKTNDGLTAELKVLRQNFTSAQEFIDNAISGSAADLSYSTPEVQVLGELNQRDMAEMQAREHENILQGVAMAASASKLSFLQIDAANKLSAGSTMDSLVRHHLESRSGPKKDVYSVEQIVSQLNATLEEIRVQQNSSDAQLRSMFEDQYQKAEENHQQLLQTQAQLNATKVSATELKVRVFEARDYLQQTHTDLLGRIKAVKQFTYRAAGGEKTAAPSRASSSETINMTSGRNDFPPH